MSLEQDVFAQAIILTDFNVLRNPHLPYTATLTQTYRKLLYKSIQEKINELERENRDG